MKCESVLNDIPLYCYGELDQDREESIEQHLASCEGCRREVERQRALMAAMNLRAAEPSAALLAQCRAGLMQEVSRIPVRRPSLWRLFGDAFGSLRYFRILRQPAGALAMMALGFVVARLTFTPAASGVSPDSIGAIRAIQPNPSGTVQVAFDEMRRRVVTGRLEDANIQRLLLAAARDRNNPGVQVESIEMLKNHTESEEVRRALLFAVATDSNPGVRLKALEGLKAFAGDPEVRKTLSKVLLTDDNPGVRIEVIDLLIAHKDTNTVGVLQNLIEREDNNYILLRCQKALQEMNASVGTF